jgi:hypothetical protein
MPHVAQTNTVVGVDPRKWHFRHPSQKAVHRRAQIHPTQVSVVQCNGFVDVFGQESIQSFLVLKLSCGVSQLSRPFLNKFFQTRVEVFELSLGSDRGGCLKNFPLAVSPCEEEVVRMRNIEELACEQPIDRIRA